MASGIVESSQSGSEQQPQQQGQVGQQVARQRLVQRLMASTSSLPNFLHDLIMTQAHVVAGTEAAAFILEPVQTEGGKPGFNLKPIAHIRPDESDADTRSAALNAFQEIVRPCVEQNKDGAIHIDGTENGGESQYCLVTLLRSEGNAVAVSAVITRSRDLERARQRLDMMSIVGGYFELFTLRRTGEQAREIAQSHQHVLQLTTAVATAEGYDAAAMNLCNELASRTGAARVSLGWVKGNNIKLKAISHSEQFDKKQELSVTLVKVMEECWDNDEIVQYEPNGTTTSTVTREAAALSRVQGGETVLSLPMRRKGEVVGVITLEFAPNTQLAQRAAQGMAVAVDLLAPQLYDRYQNDRWLITKAGLSVQDLGKKTIGPKHMLAKTVVVLVLATLAFITFYKPMYRAKAPFEFIPIEQRTFTVPFEGAQLAKVNFKPGQEVKEGDVILEFSTHEPDALLAKAEADRDLARQKKESYRVDGKTSEMEQAMWEQRSAEAQVAYYKSQIERAKIKAPFDGIILSGELADKVGATFKQGQELMAMSGKDALKARIFVPERDVQDVRKGSIGYLATNAVPYDSKSFVIERVVEEGTAKEGSNVFVAYAELQESSGQWHPGMQGEARIDVGNRRLVWIWTHRFVEFVRLKLWF
jgi:multidrug resistance efflux pump